MGDSLYELIEKAKNRSEDACIKIICKFEPIIRRFSKELNYEEARTDFIICLLEIINIMKLNNFVQNQDGAIVNYIYNSMRNKKIDLFRMHVKGIRVEQELPINLLADKSIYQPLEDVYINELLNLLTDIQKKVLIDKFINGYKDSEIADNLNISRQAVNRVKNRALKCLRVHLETIA